MFIILKGLVIGFYGGADKTDVAAVFHFYLPAGISSKGSEIFQCFRWSPESSVAETGSLLG